MKSTHKTIITSRAFLKLYKQLALAETEDVPKRPTYLLEDVIREVRNRIRQQFPLSRFSRRGQGR